MSHIVAVSFIVGVLAIIIIGAVVIFRVKPPQSDPNENYKHYKK